MAKIDAMLRMMAEKNVERAVLYSDKPYHIFAAGRRIDGSVMPGEQIRQMIEEIVPPSLASGLRNGNDFHFQHASPYGTFEIGVTNDIGTWQLTITPAKTAPKTVTASSVGTPPYTPPPPPPQPNAMVPAPAWPQNPPHPAPPASYPPPVQPAPPHQPPPAYQNPAYPPPAAPPPPAYPNPNYPPQQGYPAPGYPAPYNPGAGHLSPRSKVAAGLMGIFLPCFGVHRFYLGYTGYGVAFLVLTFLLSWPTCGVSLAATSLWGFVEGIIILCGGMTDAEGRQLSP